MTDPKDRTTHWSISPEMLDYLTRGVDGLDSPSANERVRSIEAVTENCRGDLIPKLRQLLADDAPVIWENVIGEVRQSALAGLQRLYWIGRSLPIDFGPVLVREAWPLAEMRRTYDSAIGGLSLPDRAAVLARANDFLERRVQPTPDEAEDARAYRVLQELGLVSYESQDLDPITKLTPLQEELYAKQVGSPPPRPSLRLAPRDLPTMTIGWIYRSPETRSCASRFSEHPAAVDARSILSNVLTLNEPGVPRIVHDEDGKPMVDAEGNYLLDGKIELDSDDVVGYLRTIAALMQREFATELLLPEGTDAPERSG